MTKLEFMPSPLPVSVTLSCRHQGNYSSSPLKAIPGYAGATALERLQVLAGASPLCSPGASPAQDANSVKATDTTSLEIAQYVLLLGSPQHKPQLVALVLREAQSDDILKRHPSFLNSSF